MEIREENEMLPQLQRKEKELKQDRLNLRKEETLVKPDRRAQRVHLEIKASLVNQMMV